MAGMRGLFIPGPTNVPDRVRRAMDIPMEDQRAPDLPEFTLPLFQDPLGQMMLGGAAVMQIIGIFLLRKIVAIEV